MWKKHELNKKKKKQSWKTLVQLRASSLFHTSLHKTFVTQQRPLVKAACLSNRSIFFVPAKAVLNDILVIIAVVLFKVSNGIVFLRF